MLQGKIRKVDMEARTVVVATTDGREVTATVPESMIIEVSEPETMGTMSGTLADLEVGYLVEFNIHEHEGQASDACTCTSLTCVS